MQPSPARYYWIIISLTLASLVAACTSRAVPSPTTAPSTANVITDAITVYTALEEDQVARYLPLFQARNPNIQVNVVRESTGVITDKLLSEKSNPLADVVWGLAATSLLVADAQGLLEPYTPA